MIYPYLLLSDSHLHSWDAFSGTDSNGVNTRLTIILNEIRRAAAELRKAGGNRIIHAGDIFHVRGSISPYVLNPSLSLFEELVKDGFDVIAIAGNHDLESNDSETEASLVTALGKVGVYTVAANLPVYMPGIALCSWQHSIADLKAMLTPQDEADMDSRAGRDLIIHAPVDGVISRVPDHGLTDGWLSKLGFDRVFAGHYHNHRDFGNRVYSIGATTHQTWSDVGSKAGFCLVYENRVEHFASHAPQFIDLPTDIEEDEVFTVVSGNYVRVKLENPTQALIADTRAWLTKEGAAGVLVQPVITGSTTAARRDVVDKMDSIETSVFKYAEGRAPGGKLGRLCQDILATVGGTA